MVSLLWIGGAMVLVAGGLARRRLPIGAALGMALIWVGIFAGAVAAARLLAHTG